MSQYHFDPATYLDLMRAEVPAYGRLQEAVAAATEGVRAASLLDLGAGTGETLAAVLARHPGCAAVGIDRSAGMLEAAEAEFPVELAAGGHRIGRDLDPEAQVEQFQRRLGE